MTADELKALRDRLSAALPTEEQSRDKFAIWLDTQSRGDGHDPRDLTDAQRAKYRDEFDVNRLAEVSPQDIVDLARLVKVPTRITVELKQGCARAKKTKPDGKPNTVFILASQLKHLLDQDAELPKMQPTPEPAPTE